MSPSLTFSDPLSPGESQTNHAAKSASCTRHWSNISFRSSVPSVCMCVCACVCVWIYACLEVYSEQDRRWRVGKVKMKYSWTCISVRVLHSITKDSFEAVGHLEGSTWSHKSLGKSNFHVSALPPAPGLQALGLSTNLTPLAVAADDKVDSDGSRASTRSWKWLFCASLCWIRWSPTEARFMSHRQTDRAVPRRLIDSFGLIKSHNLKGQFVSVWHTVLCVCVFLCGHNR